MQLYRVPVISNKQQIIGLCHFLRKNSFLTRTLTVSAISIAQSVKKNVVFQFYGLVGPKAVLHQVFGFY